VQPESVDKDHGKRDGHGWASLVRAFRPGMCTRNRKPRCSRTGVAPQFVQGRTPNGPRTPASIRKDSSRVQALSRVKTSAAARTPVYFAATGAAAASATASRKVLKIAHELPCAPYLVQLEYHRTI